MKVKLKPRAFWSIIEDGSTDQHEEMTVLDTLYDTVPPEMVSMITKKETITEARDTITTLRLSDDCMKKGDDATAVSEV
jgi:uncharacterized protein (DUF111 family)